MSAGRARSPRVVRAARAGLLRRTALPGAGPLLPRAHLGRDLAIKILSDKLPGGDVNLARFEREACSASALNHPNIVTIFELGQVDATYYIAMELVDGERLRDMLSAGLIQQFPQKFR